MNGGQDFGADIITVLEESSHVLVRSVAEANGDAKKAARGVVSEAIQAAEFGRIGIPPPRPRQRPWQA